MHYMNLGPAVFHSQHLPWWGVFHSLPPNRSVLRNAHTAELQNNCERDGAMFLNSFKTFTS